MQKGNFGYIGDDYSNDLTSFVFPNSFNQDLNILVSQYTQLLQQQMYDHDFPSIVSQMSHESGVISISHESVVTKLGSLCNSPNNPKIISFKKIMEHGTSTPNGKLIALAEMIIVIITSKSIV